MRTSFTEAALADPAVRKSERVIRTCVHCGFCTATCPTYVLLGDELDSPRGRIVLIKDMLESGATPTAEIVRHVDRCLSCLACMTTCPSGVNYMHLVDHARAHIEAHYERPLRDRLVRALLARVLPHPARFRLALAAARLARPTAPLFRRIAPLRPLAAMMDQAPARAAPRAARTAPAVPNASGRVILLGGCAEPVLRPEIRDATLRLLARLGIEVAFAPGEGCCGALVHHMGREQEGLAAVRRNVDAWSAEIERAPVRAIVVTASGCGTQLKNMGFLLRDDPAYAERAARVSALACDVSELLATLDFPTVTDRGLTVAYHSACSLQHGQRVTAAPQTLLARAGYAVRAPDESHICCGSAGTYSILQPEIADTLGRRKAERLDRLGADVIATGNIGCAMHLAARSRIPVVHTVELLDWATGGPRPALLADVTARRSAA